MLKFLRRIFSFSRIRKQAAASNKRPYDNRRIVAQRLFYITLIVFVAIILRLTWLIAANSVNGVNLKQMAQSNYTYTYTVYPKRGTIYDRFGTPIAQDSSTFTLYVSLDKNYIDASGKKLYAQPSDFPQIVDFINKELPAVPKDYIEAQLTRKGVVQAYFGSNANGLSYDQMKKIQADATAQKVVGIGFDSTLSRAYPNGIFASNFIGATQLTDAGGTTGLVGTMGVEQALNTVLEGQPSTKTVEKGPNGVPIPGAVITSKPSKDGSDVYLTISSDLQASTEAMLDSLYKSTNAEQMSAVLVEAKTGDILATSQRPTFNPQNMSGTNQDYFTWSNLMYQLPYEPGSTMKTFLAASAMDSGKWTPNTTYDRSSLTFPDGTTIKDWDYNEYPPSGLRSSIVTFAQGFAWSSNVGMGKMEEQMGYNDWGNYLQRFGFGKPTRMGIGMGEYEGFGSVPGSSDVVSQVSSAFGQGIGVTELQLLKGWTSFANGGEMLEPHYIKNIVNSNSNTVLQADKEIVGKPISATTAKNIATLMQTVNTDSTYGTANDAIFKGGSPRPLFVINGQPAAVKTGTAQIAGNNGYMTGQYDVLNSIVVMYPAENPDFIFYLTAKIAPQYDLPNVAPQVNALITQAETEKDLLDNTQLNLPAAKVTIGNYFSKSTGATLDNLRNQLLQPVAIGNGGTVDDQSIPSGSQVSANTKILLYTNGNHTMPDMYGWSKSDVDQLAKWYNIKVTYQGQIGGKNQSTGQVTGQSIPDLAIVKNNTNLTVTLGSVN